MTDNTQELDEILDKFGWTCVADGGDGYGLQNEDIAEAKQAILDWHNKQIEEAMAKFHLKKGVKYDVKAGDSVIVITHTNKLKESK